MERFRNWATTSIGLIFMLAAVAMVLTSMFTDYDFTILEVAGISILGWVFLRAKYSLLEGVFMNMFKKK